MILTKVVSLLVSQKRKNTLSPQLVLSSRVQQAHNSSHTALQRSRRQCRWQLRSIFPIFIVQSNSKNIQVVKSSWRDQLLSNFGTKTLAPVGLVTRWQSHVILVYICNLQCTFGWLGSIFTLLAKILLGMVSDCLTMHTVYMYIFLLELNIGNPQQVF